MKLYDVFIFTEIFEDNLKCEAADLDWLKQRATLDSKLSFLFIFQPRDWTLEKRDIKRTFKLYQEGRGNQRPDKTKLWGHKRKIWARFSVEDLGNLPDQNPRSLLIATVIGWIGEWNTPKKVIQERKKEDDVDFNYSRLFKGDIISIFI